MDVLVELIKIFPSLLWFAFVVTLIIWFYRPLKEQILPRLKTFEAAGVKLSLISESISAAAELADKSPQWRVVISEQDKLNVEHRARENISVFKGVFILWVDDQPENNLNERKMFKQLGVDIDVVTNTEDAVTSLQSGNYDLVFSDMTRGENPMAGLDLLNELKKNNISKHVVFYIGVDDPDKAAPDSCFGITNRPDHLLHYTLDVLERIKY